LVLRKGKKRAKGESRKNDLSHDDIRFEECQVLPQ
jgi:hypothetical protein